MKNITQLMVLLFSIIILSCNYSKTEKVGAEIPEINQIKPSNAKMRHDIEKERGELWRILEKIGLANILISNDKKYNWQSIDSIYSNINTLDISTYYKAELKKRAIIALVSKYNLMQNGSKEKIKFYANEVAILLDHTFIDPSVSIEFLPMLKISLNNKKFNEAKNNIIRQCNVIKGNYNINKINKEMLDTLSQFDLKRATKAKQVIINNSKRFNEIIEKIKKY